MWFYTLTFLAGLVIGWVSIDYIRHLVAPEHNPWQTFSDE